jgi:putative peptidoglycan lipid II flippase
MLKSGIVVSSMTLISRVLGLVRDVVVANLMGAGAAADVFFFANKIPNFLRRLFAEGAFAQAFVPVLTEVKAHQDKAELEDFVAKVSGTLGAIVFITAIVGVVLSPVLAALFGTGWFIDYLNDEPDGANFELASVMLKITFPYIFFISLTGFAGAVLNTLNKFAVAAFTPVLLNLSIIACAWLFAERLEQPAFALAWGVFIGGIVQLLFQLPFLYRAGLLVKPKWGWRDPNVTKVRILMIPALFGVSVSQINLLLDTATVILPALSRNHVGKDNQGFKNNLDWAFKIICLLGIPAATALVLLAFPLLMVIFQRGEFSVVDAQMASYSLIAYGSGLLGFMLVKILAPAFYARQDTRTPVKYGIITMATNMLFNLIFAIPFGYVGLAIATAMSGTLNAILLYQRLHRQGIYKLRRDTLSFIIKVVLASIFMGISIYIFNLNFAWGSTNLMARVNMLIKLVVLGISVFAISLILVGIRPSHLKIQKSI